MSDTLGIKWQNDLPKRHGHPFQPAINPIWEELIYNETHRRKKAAVER
jgi:hypothetical protein